MDPLDLFLRNLSLTGPLAGTYREELEVAARLMDWKRRWRPRGQQQREGPCRRGLGLSIHTWRARRHGCTCEVLVHPVGTVEGRLSAPDP
ncbi:MAG: hypothetical protein ACE5HD_08685 [Acidobacteriota bacterium]